jgi:hypothetical protein
MLVTLTKNNPATLSKSVLYDSSLSVSEEVIRSRSLCGPEPQQWRRTAEAISSMFAVSQLVLAVVFLVVALVQVAISFAELSRLLERDAIKNVAERVISESDLKSGYDQVTAPAAVSVRGPVQTAVWSRTTSFPEMSPGHAGAEKSRPART